VETQLILLASAIMNTMQRILLLFFDILPQAIELACFLCKLLWWMVKQLAMQVFTMRRQQKEAQQEAMKKAASEVTGTDSAPVPLKALDAELESV
jgi:hypothetical protein